MYEQHQKYHHLQACANVTTQDTFSFGFLFFLFVFFFFFLGHCFRPHPFHSLDFLNLFRREKLNDNSTSANCKPALFYLFGMSRNLTTVHKRKLKYKHVGRPRPSSRRRGRSYCASAVPFEPRNRLDTWLFVSVMRFL
jgi:hypothetical protein